MSDASAQRARIYVFHIRIVDRASKSGVRSQEPVPSTRENSLQGKSPSLKTRARERARSHEPVPLWNILPEPESWDNPAIRAKKPPPTRKMGIISKGATAPGNNHQRGQKQNDSASEPCASATISGVLGNLNGKRTPTNLTGWQPPTKQPTNYLP